ADPAMVRGCSCDTRTDAAHGGRVPGRARRAAAARAASGLVMATTAGRLAVLCALVLIGAGCGRAAPSSPSSADVALYDGQDRIQRLTDGAKREGALTIYTSAQTN